MFSANLGLTHLTGPSPTPVGAGGAPSMAKPLIGANSTHLMLANLGAKACLGKVY